MNAHDLAAFLAMCRNCAIGMLSNAEYVERELVNTPFSEELRELIHEFCQSLVGTKHDIFSEVAELDELMASAAIDEAKIVGRMERMVRWLAEDVAKIDPVVRLVQTAAQHDPALTSTSILVSESMANIIREFRAVRETMTWS